MLCIVSASVYTPLPAASSSPQLQLQVQRPTPQLQPQPVASYRSTILPRASSIWCAGKPIAEITPNLIKSCRIPVLPSGQVQMNVVLSLPIPSVQFIAIQRVWFFQTSFAGLFYGKNILWKIMENNLTCSYIFSLEFCIIYIFVYVSHLYFFINQEKRYYSLFLENIFLWYVWYIRCGFINKVIYILICLHRKLESCIYECIFLLLKILNRAISNF